MLPDSPLFELRQKVSPAGGWSNSAVNFVRFASGNDDRLFSGNAAGCVSLWCLHNRRELFHQQVSPAKAPIFYADFFGFDLNRIVIQSKNGQISVWDTTCSTCLSVVDTENYSFASVCQLNSFGVDGPSGEGFGAHRTMVASPFYTEGAVGIFDLSRSSNHEKRPIVQFDAPKARNDTSSIGSSCGMVTSITQLQTPTLAPHCIAVAYEGSMLAVFDIRQPSAPVTPPLLFESTEPLTSACLTRSQLWAGNAAGTIYVCSIRRSGQIVLKQTLEDQTLPSQLTAAEAVYLLTPDDKKGIGCMAARSDSRLIVVGCWDHRIRLYDVKTVRRILPILRCHQSSVTGVAFAAESGPFASCGADGRIAVWDTLANTYLSPAALNVLSETQAS